MGALRTHDPKCGIVIARFLVIVINGSSTGRSARASHLPEQSPQGYQHPVEVIALQLVTNLWTCHSPYFAAHSLVGDGRADTDRGRMQCREKGRGRLYLRHVGCWLDPGTLSARGLICE